MKHHIFHKSYRNYHILSLIIAVVIVGAWVHFDTQKANSDIKLGYVRNFRTLDSADFGDKGKPDEGSNTGGTVSRMAHGLVEYVKELIGVTSPSKLKLEEALGTSAVDLGATDPCIAIEEANLVSVLSGGKTAYSDARQPGQGGALANQTVYSVAVRAQANPCTNLPVELLPCAANYQDPRKDPRKVNRPDKPISLRLIPRAEAETDTPPSKEDATTTVPGLPHLVTPCTFASGATAKASLKNTLIENIGSYIPLSLKLGDTGEAVTKYQKLLLKLSDGKFADTITIGVYDQVMVDIVKDAQKRLKDKGYNVVVNGSVDVLSRNAFLSQFSDQIDEFLARYKDAPIGAQAPFVSAFTQIDLANTVPIVVKIPKDPGDSKTFTGDPCLALTPVVTAVKSAVPTNPCSKVPTILLPCAENYVEIGGIIVNNKKVPACEYVPASSAKESLKQTMLNYIGKYLPKDVILKVGDHNDNVKMLQKLVNVAFKTLQSDKDITEDGVFGKDLEALILKFEEKAGLKQDGMYSGKVRDAFLSTLTTQIDQFLTYYSVMKSNLIK